VAYLIVDTSSIVFGFTYKEDVFAIAKKDFPSMNMLISVGILNELSKLSRNKGKKGAAAKTAIESLRYKKINVDSNTGSVDSWIFNKAKEYPHSVVITNDTELFKKLKASEIRSLKLTKTGLLR
jgi:rRNA-processing protein FCF1